MGLERENDIAETEILGPNNIIYILNIKDNTKKNKGIQLDSDFCELDFNFQLLYTFFFLGLWL